MKQLLLSSRDAAKIIGCTQRYLSQRIKKGVVKATRYGGFYLLLSSEVERFKSIYKSRAK